MQFKLNIKKLIESLQINEIKICAAESITGGKFSHEITKNSGASKIFDYSTVCYSNYSKSSILGIDCRMKLYNPVSKEVAGLMAKNVTKFSNNKKILGISCTGQAGPEILNNKEKVGTVFIGTYYKDKLFINKKKFEFKNRLDIINATVMEMVNQCLIIIEQ